MIILGAGRIGTALAARSPDARVITRANGWQVLQEAAGEPILVATRNDDLDAVCSQTPAHRRGDLVFLQNGMLRPWLAAHGLAANTRGILRFAVATRGADPVVGEASWFCGHHADAIASWLNARAIAAKAVTSGEFAQLELEKLVWNCAMGLVCQVYACTVGQAVTDHAQLSQALVRELGELGAQALEVTFSPDEFWSNIARYSLSIADYRAAVREWPWRNGWFVATALAQQVDLPVHRQLCEKAGL